MTDFTMLVIDATRALVNRLQCSNTVFQKWNLSQQSRREALPSSCYAGLSRLTLQGLVATRTRLAAVHCQV